MNDTITNSQVSEKFVWRRLEEPLRMFGRDMPDYTWLVILGVVLAVALFYVVWMYIKDSKGVGPIWATLLGALRLSVYAILAVVFLLPARQRSTTTSTEGRVVVVWDVSDSLQTSDQQPTGAPNEKLETRMERVIAMATTKDGAFIGDLLKKNPVSMYRLGSRLDSSRLLLNGEGMRLASVEATGRDEGKAQLLLEKPPLNEQFWGMWLMPNKPLDPEEAEALTERLKLSAARTSYELADKAIESAESDLERKQKQQERDKRRKELDDAELSARKVQQKAGPKSARVWELPEADLVRSAVARLHQVNEKARLEKVAGGTNLGDSLLGVLNREGGNRLQEIGRAHV